MLQNKLLDKVENHVKDLFNKRFVADNIYHNIAHTEEVVLSAYDIAIEEKISNDEIELILIAAWFHDIGYFHCCKGHEDQSSEYARDFLINENYPQDKIEIILDCIKSTKIPQLPKSKLEQILCDADLHHLGTIEFDEKGSLLRVEIESKGIRKFSDIEWLRASIEFIKKHKFFTESADKKFGKQKINNQRVLEERLKLLETNLMQEK